MLKYIKIKHKDFKFQYHIQNEFSCFHSMYLKVRDFCFFFFIGSYLYYTFLYSIIDPKKF